MKLSSFTDFLQNIQFFMLCNKMMPYTLEEDHLVMFMTPEVANIDTW